MSLLAILDRLPWWMMLLIFIGFLAFALALRRDPEFFRHLLDRRPRVYGLVVMAFGTAIMYFFVYTPLSDAVADKNRLMIARGLGMLATFLIVMGLVAAVAGSHTPRLIPTGRDGRMTPLHCVVLVVCMLLAIAVEVAFGRALRELGFRSLLAPRR